MSSGTSDFDAAKAVADQLKGMDKAQQQRILRWVAESLGLEHFVPSPTAARTGEAIVSAEQSTHTDQQHPPLRTTNIKTFVDLKQPKSDVQFATVVAYFYRFEAPIESRKESIDAQTLQEAARLAGRRRSPKPLMTLNNAKRLGYLDTPERGQFRVNSVGENLVAMTLPGTQPERPKKASRPKRSQKAKKKL
jgi:hypothetical protein